MENENVFASLNDGKLKVIAPLLESIVREKGEYGEDYARGLNYLLAITEKFNSSGFQDSYAIIGGFAVFAHMYSLLEERTLTEWRGSVDLDVMAKHRSIDTLIGNSFEEVERIITHFKDKSTLYVKDEIELIRELEYGKSLKSPLKIDIYIPENGRFIEFNYVILEDEFWDRTESINVLGYGIRVAGLTDMLKFKLDVEIDSSGLPRTRDITDIYNLMGIAEIKGVTAKKVYDSLTEKQRLKLRKLILMHNFEGAPHEEVRIEPSPDYLQEYSRLVK